MSQPIANALYDIFVKELRARESTRWDFCEQYDKGLDEIPLYCIGSRADLRAWYMRKPNHLGEVISTFDLQGVMWTNQAIRDLETHLSCMSPLEKLAWFNGEVIHG